MIAVPSLGTLLYHPVGIAEATANLDLSALYFVRRFTAFGPRLAPGFWRMLPGFWWPKDNFG